MITHVRVVAVILLAGLASYPAAVDAQGPVAVASATKVSEMPDVSGGVWHPANPDRDAAVVVRIDVERGREYDTNDFMLAYELKGKPVKARCAGASVRLPDGWSMNEKGMQWTMFPGGTGTLNGLGLLFVVPKEIASATLFYQNKPVGVPLTVK